MELKVGWNLPDVASVLQKLKAACRSILRLEAAEPKKPPEIAVD